MATLQFNTVQSIIWHHFQAGNHLLHLSEGAMERALGIYTSIPCIKTIIRKKGFNWFAQDLFSHSKGEQGQRVYTKGNRSIPLIVLSGERSWAIREIPSSSND